MGGEGLAGHVVDHLVGVAVVGGHEGDAAVADDLIHQDADILVHFLHGRLRRRHETGMAHHVAVGVVEDHHVILFGADGFQRLSGDLGGRHLRQQVEGGHLAGRHQDPVLPLVGGFDAAVEEEGDMRVLLRLGNVQLGLAQL